MGSSPSTIRLEWLSHVDWSPLSCPWGFLRHRLGFYVKLGSRGLNVRNPWVRL